MPETFASLASLLRGAPSDPEPPESAPAPPSAGDLPPDSPPELDEVLREIRFFRAHLEEAIDLAVGRAIEDIGASVLGRELALASADIANVVERVKQELADEEPVRLRLHPDDASCIPAQPFAIVADAHLRRGDAIFDVRNGSVDASLGVRFADVLRWAVQ